MALNYCIIVDDSGELKTITAKQVENHSIVDECTIERVINEILDGEVEKEPGTQMPRGFKQGDSGDEDR